MKILIPCERFKYFPRILFIENISSREANLRFEGFPGKKGQKEICKK